MTPATGQTAQARLTTPNGHKHVAGLLEQAGDPAVLRGLAPDRLAALAGQIRSFLIAKVAAAGGHLGPNLGAAELTIALHRVFHSPRDAILFDTGHQAYVHKILTGRRDGFDRLRQAGGLSGYPSRGESVHDWIENSHASTALSYADGLAKAFALQGTQDRAVVAVVGDGALTGGMAYEALNNIGAAQDRPVIVVLNDNTRSYDPTVGALAAHLAALREGRQPAGPAGHRGCAGNLFENLGFAYLGPVDGHDIAALEVALRQARTCRRPTVVHAVTMKGRGYDPAEHDQADRMHAVAVIDPATGAATTAGGQSWTTAFGAQLLEIAARRPDVVAITAAMRLPTGLGSTSAIYTSRVFDVGIAEQHAVTSAAGLAMGGMHPVVCVYATFLSRAFDQVLMDVALHKLPVTFVLDRAGITGPDGPSHHGMWDTALLSMVPGLRLAAPRDPARLRELLTEATDHAAGPTAIRFPKACTGTNIDAVARLDGIDILHRTRRMPPDVLLVAAGVTAGECLKAASDLEAAGIGVTVADPRWIAPVNPALVHLAARHRLAVSVEDACRTGGAGSLLTAACAEDGLATPIRGLGLPPAFIAHGERDDLLATHGLTGKGIAATVLDALHATQETGGDLLRRAERARTGDLPMPADLQPRRVPIVGSTRSTGTRASRRAVKPRDVIAITQPIPPAATHHQHATPPAPAPPTADRRQI